MTARVPVPKSPPSRFPTRNSWWSSALQLLIVLLVAGGLVGLQRLHTLPERIDDQQTIVVGPRQFAPDSDASLRVVVQDAAGGQAIEGARVKLRLKPEIGGTLDLYEGRTDASGSLPVQFHLPTDLEGPAQLIVETDSELGRDRIEQTIIVQRDYRLLISSDKPLYQPGQTIHMRVLALNNHDLSPARGSTVDFVVQDPKGNKVYRQSVTTSDFGVAALDFTLADMVNQGSYKLGASIGDTGSEKTVEVRPYVLPKFGLSVSTERSFYLPGERVEGLLQADYFFGKPVAQGQVQIEGTVWDVGRNVLLELQGQTDENGAFAFSFDLPDYFAGSGLDAGQAQFALEVTVIDQTEHAEQTSLVLPIAAQPLLIEAVAESGALKPGVENVVYLLTTYPDGRPAPTRMQFSLDGGEPVDLRSSQFGLAEFRFVPRSGATHALNVTARDEAGRSAGRQFALSAEAGGDSVLLRADRASYVVGETMHLLALSPLQSGSIYLDVVKAGQTLSTRSALVQGGRAEFVLDVGPELYGTIELHAYKVLLDGTIVRDSRLVLVDAPNDLAIGIHADRDSYLPGDVAHMAFQTSAAAHPDLGVQAVLGLAIVDESVFALQQQDPGFAKLYFMLEQELLEPFYQVQGFDLPSTLPPDQEPAREAQDLAAKASWAGLTGASAAPLNSRPQKQEALRQAQLQGFELVGQAGAVAMLLIPLSLWAVGLLALRKSGLLGRSLLRLLLAMVIVLAVTVPLGFVLARHAEALLPPLLVLAAAGVLVLGGYGWARGDRAAQLFALFSLAWAAALFVLVRASDWAAPPQGLLVAALLAYLLVPGAYLLLGQGRWLQARRFAGGLASGLGGLLTIPALGVALLSLSLFNAGVAGTAWPGGAPPQDLVLEDGMVLRGAPMPTPAPALEKDGAGRNEQAAAGEPPRLRQYFPETLYWAPEVLTDENGYVVLDVPMADSITTWRLTALASSQDGRLGFATQGLRVFQDFFVDVDLPVALTQGDEISIPVGVFNYLPQEQEVRLVVQQESWFELLGPQEQTLLIASNDIEVVYFPIRVREFGWRGFQVTAWGSQMNDAIRRQVRVLPDGQEVRLSESDWLRQTKTVAVDIPAGTVPGTAYVEVKIYPGVMAQVIEGLEKILRLPHG
ncbi:MAG: hypothetical protein JXA37_11415 [Chloroflexia bacterium]|nr:hypothetical protein [Chloroflexia bacterium]